MTCLALIAQLVVATAEPWTASTASIVEFNTAGVTECRVSQELHVSGPKPQRCVEYLEMKARLARMEMRVNAGIERKKR